MRERKRRGPERGPADDGTGDQSESASELASDSATDLGRIVKPRLEELLAFAQVYRGWSAKELAKFIGRDVHNVIPASGVPKIDLVAKLAEALDWQPGAAFDHLCGGQVPATPASPVAEVTDYRQLNREAYRAFEEGRFEDMIALGLRMEHVASSPDERAEACLRQYGGWEGLGRYEQAVSVLQRALRERELCAPLRMRLRGNLAMVYCSLGQWMESEGVAISLLEDLTMADVPDASADGIRAAALFALGASRRSRSLHEVDQRRIIGARAVLDLRRAKEACQAHADRSAGCPSYSAASHTCVGAIVTAEALAGQREPAAAIRRVLEELDRCPSERSELPKAMIESFGWWCVFGCDLALELDPSDASRDHVLARLTLLGLDLAEASTTWALRERMLTIEYLRWSSSDGSHPSDAASSLDREDFKLIAGAMARFPGFRPFGWELVGRAARVD